MKKQGIAALICIGAAAAVFVCATVWTGKKEAQEEKSDTVTLDWYVNFSWYSGEWGKNLVSRAITEKTGVSVRFLSPPGNESEKLDALIGADSLPDIITLGWWEPQIGTMIEKDMVYAYNELADKYDAAFWKVADPDVVEWYTQEDGNIYSYPNSFYTPEDLEIYDNIPSNETFLVRKDIYEAIGSPDMSTQEGFEAAVKKAAQMYPEVDGKPLIPVGAHVFDNVGCVSFDSYLQNFLAVPYEKDGAVYDRNTDPEYLSWLKMFRSLGQEGYLKPDIFVDTRTQMDEKIAEGRYFCMLYQYTDILDMQRKLAEENPDGIYMAVDGPKNSRGDDPRLPVNGLNGWTVTLISKNCKDPGRAIKFVDYLLSEEGQKTTYLGIEGVTYDMKDGKATLKPEVHNLLNTDRAAYDEKYGADYCYWMLQDLSIQAMYRQEPPEYIAQMQEWTYPYAVYQQDYLFPKGSEEAAMEDEIKSLWSKTLPELLLAKDETAFDEMLDGFVKQRDDLGFAQVQEKKTEYMKQAKEKLGIR